MSPSKYISIFSDCQVMAAPFRTQDVEPSRGISALSADSQSWALFSARGPAAAGRLLGTSRQVRHAEGSRDSGRVPAVKCLSPRNEVALQSCYQEVCSWSA